MRNYKREFAAYLRLREATEHACAVARTSILDFLAKPQLTPVPKTVMIHGLEWRVENDHLVREFEVAPRVSLPLGLVNPVASNPTQTPAE